MSEKAAPRKEAEIQKPQNLAQAVIQVMREVKGIEKNLNVGVGKASYKGVADKDVKQIIGAAMERAGLCILPIEIQPKIQMDRWEESTDYGVKQKQSIFTEVICRYELIHESGESKIIQGYGHGVDSQDKSAGKATTYALKYALLYSFLVPTGEIDDAELSNSNYRSIGYEEVKAMFNSKKNIIAPSELDAVEKVIDGKQAEKYQRVYNYLSKLEA